MKDLNLILETERIKELMKVEVLNEIKIPRAIISGIIRSASKPVTFVGVADDDLAKVLPKIAGSQTDDVVLDFLTRTDDITADQLKILLKIDDDEIRNALISAAGEDDIIKRLMKVLVNAEKGGISSDISQAKSMLNKYMDDNVMDPIKNKIKLELEAEDAAKLARIEGQKASRILAAQAEIESANKVLNDFALDNKMTIFKSSEARKKLKATIKGIEKLKEEDYKLLTRQMQIQLDSIESQLDELSPGMKEWWKGKKGYYDKLGVVGKCLFWIAVAGSPIGAVAEKNKDTFWNYLSVGACRIRAIIRIPCDGNNAQTPIPVVTPTPTIYKNDENGLKKWISNTYDTDISLITVTKQSDGTWEASKSGGNKLKFFFNNGTFSKL